MVTWDPSSGFSISDPSDVRASKGRGTITEKTEKPTKKQQRRKGYETTSKMLACVYPSENFKSKAVTVKLRHGKSKRKQKLLSVREKSETAKNSGSQAVLKNELPVGAGCAVLVLSELESMAARQQREIAHQRRLMEQREARLAVLRGAQEPAQQDRLARLRHRLDQEQSKLNRLRLLRSQNDQSRANNATLTSDLDCIRALFNEKEKELSLAVAKVEELTRQLEEVRGRYSSGAAGGSGHLPTPASAELDKLRRELMYRNKMNEQQNQVVSQQRLALVQRQAEMASIDARIAQLQGRLQRKRALNQRLSQQFNSSDSRPVSNSGSFNESKLDFSSGAKTRPTGNIAAIEPYSHIPNDNDFNLNKNDPKYQTLPYNTKFTVNFKTTDDDVNKNKIQQSASASQVGQRPTFQQFGHQIVHSQSQSHIQGQSQPLGTNQQLSNAPSLGTNSNGNNNVGGVNNNNAANHNNAIAENQTISQNLRLLAHQQHALSQQKQQHGSTTSSSSSLSSNNQPQNHRNVSTHQKPVSSVAPSFPVKSPIYQTSSTKIHPVMPQTLSLISRGLGGQTYPASTVNQNGPQQQIAQNVSNSDPAFRHNYPGIAQNANSTNPAYQSQNSPNQNSTHASSGGNFNNFSGYNQGGINAGPVENDRMKFESTKGQDKEHTIRNDQNHLKYEPQQVKYEQHTASKFEPPGQPVKLFEQNSKYDNSKMDQFKQHEHTTQNFKEKYELNQTKFDQLGPRYEPHGSVPSKHDYGSKFEPPSNKPEKPFEYERLKGDGERKSTGLNETKTEDKTKPALPPKPSKPHPPPRLTHHDKVDVIPEVNDEKSPNNVVSRPEKEEEIIPPIPTSEPPESPTDTQLGHQVIKARPLTLKKSPVVEQPKLRYAKSNVHVSINRRIEMPPAFLFPETEIPADLMQTEQHIEQQQQQQQQQQINDVTDSCLIKKSPISPTILDEVICNDKLDESDIVDALNVLNIEDHKSKAKTEADRRSDQEIDSKSAEILRRKKGNLKSTTGKVNLSRRVSFDPLALLLDASLEGELELVKKTAKEVANPSSANDEGITALHNAICAGHLEIVKFLVEFGCDVNAQDSDGWTPLHCAASCNNLAMVRFLVEHGACIFATTLSDHETAAEKCEEDEEGFDGCSEYLYSVQEKLGIMNNGQAFAVFDYEAQHSDELTLKNGDSLVILRKGDDNEREWWWSKLGHREGYVPRNLLGLYPRVQPAKVD